MSDNRAGSQEGSPMQRLVGRFELEPCVSSTKTPVRSGAGGVKRAEVWSCGGGTQSIAIAALIVQGRLPAPDVSVIVNTGKEKRSTWEYADAVLVPALAAVGVTLHRITTAEWANQWGRGYVAKSGQTLIPAFTNQSGEVGKLTNYCSKAWKVEARNRWLSAVWKLTEAKRRMWIGYSHDEPRRWGSMHGKPEYRLPLVDDVPMRRHECKRLVVAMGWPEPPRSACYMCPNQSDEEWLETKENRPDEFALAVVADKEVRALDPFAYLHEQCVPLDEVDWTKPQGDFVRACNSGECFV